MPLRPFRKQQSGDRLFNKSLSATSSAIAGLRKGPFGDGNLITDLVMPASNSIVVNHGLNRAYQGFITTSASSAWTSTPGLLYIITDPVTAGFAGLDPTKQILLGGPAGLIFSVWVF